MLIRKAEASDYEQLMQLYNLFIGTDRYSMYEKDSFKMVLNDPNSYIFVAEKDDNLVGLATMSIRHIVRYPQPIAQLEELFVLENYRQHGIGSQFVEEVEKIAREHDCYRVYIESGYKHKPAHTFYEKIGYTNYGVHFIKNL